MAGDAAPRRAYRGRVYSRYVSVFKRPDAASRSRSAKQSARVLDHLLGPLVRATRPTAILELGCGPGHFLHWARARGLAAIGIDASPEQVSEVRALGLVAEVGLAEEYLSGRDAQFDLIVALDLVEHLDRDEGFALLDSCRQALRPGGWLYLTTPNGAALRPGPVASGDLTHETIYAPDTIRLALTLCGFDGIEVREVAPPPLSWRSRIRRILWALVRLGAVIVDVIETGRPSGHVYTRVMAVVARRPPTNTDAAALSSPGRH